MYLATLLLGERFYAALLCLALMYLVMKGIALGVRGGHEPQFEADVEGIGEQCGANRILGSQATRDLPRFGGFGESGGQETKAGNDRRRAASDADGRGGGHAAWVQMLGVSFLGVIALTPKMTKALRSKAFVCLVANQGLEPRTCGL